MAKKNLLDIITLSGIRKELLLYLDDGPRSLSEIREYLNVTSPEVSPRIKELMEYKLVTIDSKKYHLTTMGKTIVSNFRPFLDTVNVFDQFPDFWNNHDLNSIPDNLLKRIGEIKNFMIIEDDNSNINRTNIEIYNVIKSSNFILGITCVFENNFPDICINAARENIPISVILTKSIYDIVINNYKEELTEFISYDNAKLLVCYDEIKISLVVTNDCLLLYMYYNNGKFDMHSNLISNDISSLKWGQDLFNYYLSRSIEVSKII